MGCGGIDYLCIVGEIGFVGDCILDGMGDCMFSSLCGGIEIIDNCFYVIECV